MTTQPLPDEADYLRKYGVVDMAPARVAKPCEPLFTAAEHEEMRRFEAMKASGYLVGRPKPPLHPNPLVNEIAEMLLTTMK